MKTTKNIEGSSLRKYVTGTLTALAIAGCAGTQRSCSSSCASELGADWLVVQYKYDGEPMNCWQLHNTSVANEHTSDGIYWLDAKSRNLVHISGWYNRVQVENDAWKEAANAVGVDLEKCVGGKYKAEKAEPTLHDEGPTLLNQ